MCAFIFISFAAFSHFQKFELEEFVKHLLSIILLSHY